MKDHTRGTQLKSSKGRRGNETHVIDMRKDKSKTRQAFKIKQKIQYPKDSSVLQKVEVPECID